MKHSLAIARGLALILTFGLWIPARGQERYPITTGGAPGTNNAGYIQGAVFGNAQVQSNLAWTVASYAPTLTSNYSTINLGAGTVWPNSYGHIQGVARGTNNDIYLAFTTALFKISNNAAWSNGTAVTLLASNTTAQGTTLPGVDHYGALKWFNGRIYATAETFNSETSFSGQTLAIFNQANLSYLKSAPATNGNYEVSGLGIVPTGSTNGVIFICGYRSLDGSGNAQGGNDRLREYDANSLAYLGDFLFANGGIPLMQDVEWSTYFNRFYITANAPNAYNLEQCDLQGRWSTVLGTMGPGSTPTAPFTFYFGQGDSTLEGLSFRSNEVQMSYFNGVNGNLVSSVTFADRTVANIDYSGNLAAAQLYSSGSYTRFPLTNQNTGGWVFTSNAVANVDIFNLDGSGWLDNNNISWDAAGNLTTAATITANGSLTTKNTTNNVQLTGSVIMGGLLQLTNSPTNCITLQTNSTGQFGTAVANCVVLISTTAAVQPGITHWSVQLNTGTAPSTGVLYTNTWPALSTVPLVLINTCGNPGLAVPTLVVTSVTVSNCVVAGTSGPSPNQTYTNKFLLVQ